MRALTASEGVRWALQYLRQRALWPGMTPSLALTMRQHLSEDAPPRAYFSCSSVGEPNGGKDDDLELRFQRTMFSLAADRQSRSYAQACAPIHCNPIESFQAKGDACRDQLLRIPSFEVLRAFCGCRCTHQRSCVFIPSQAHHLEASLLLHTYASNARDQLGGVSRSIGSSALCTRCWSATSGHASYPSAYSHCSLLRLQLCP